MVKETNMVELLESSVGQLVLVSDAHDRVVNIVRNAGHRFPLYSFAEDAALFSKSGILHNDGVHWNGFTAAGLLACRGKLTWRRVATWRQESGVVYDFEEPGHPIAGPSARWYLGLDGAK